MDDIEKAKKAFQTLYGSHIQILSHPPSKEEIQRTPSFFEKVSNAAGVPSWLWKSVSGTVIGIIFIAPALDDAVEWWSPKVVSTYENSMQYVEYIRQNSPAISGELIGFLGDPLNLQREGNDYDLLVPEIAQKSFTDNSNHFSGKLWRIVRRGHPFENYNLADEINFILNRKTAFSSRFSDGRVNSILYLADDFLTALEHYRYHYKGMLSAIDQEFNEVTMLSELAAIELNVIGNTEVVPTSFFNESKHRADFTETQYFGHKWATEMRSDMLISPSFIRKNSTIYVCNLLKMKDQIDLERITYL